MTTEKHGSKIEGRDEPIPDDIYASEGNFYSVVSRRGMGWEFFNKWRSRMSEFPKDPSPQSPAEPGRGDDLARQERMAELEREIAEKVHERDLLIESSPNGLSRDELASVSVISRLRNEGEGEEAARLAEKEAHMDCYQYGKVDGPTASPSDLPARKAIERAASLLEEASKDFRNEFQVYAKQFADAAKGLYAALSQGSGAPGHTDLMVSPEAIDEAIEPLYAAPPSQLEGVREALEKIANHPHRDGESRSIARAALANLTTAPSRGLVEAAEWQPIETFPKNHFPQLVWSEALGRIVAFKDVTGAWWPCPAIEPLSSEPTHWTPLLPSPSRTLSAKPTANAADREGDREL